MKKTIVLIVIALGAISIKSSAQIAVDPAYDSVSVLDLDHYATLPVDSFLHVIPQSYNSFGLYSTLNPNGKVRGLWIRYATGLAIMIEPKIYNYMNPYDTSHVWDINLFKKEIASYIVIIHPDHNGISGSNQP